MCIFPFLYTYPGNNLPYLLYAYYVLLDIRTEIAKFCHRLSELL